METDPPADYGEQLQALRRHYVDTLQARIDEIETGWRDLVAAFDTDKCHKLFRTVHSLAGSAPSFGHNELGDAARAMEGLLDVLREQPDPPTAEHETRVTAWIADLRRLAAEAKDRVG